MNFIICPVCQNKDAYFYAKKNGFDFWRSKGCGFIFVSPPPERPPADIYSQDYFSGAKAGFGYANYDEDKPAMAHLFKEFLALMESHSPGHGELLDVGAATGYFVELANQAGWSAQGIDISAYATEQARKKGLKVETATLDSFKAPKASFAAVTMWDLLEHVPDPAATVKNAHDLLRPGGLVAIVTPDGGSLWAKIWRSKWHTLVPPEHVFIFSKKSLKMLLNKTGFEVITAANPVKKFTPAYVLKVFSRWIGSPAVSRLVGALGRWPFNSMSIPIPIRDNVFMLARKK